MNFIDEMLHNQIFISAISGWFVAQVLKTLIHMFITREFVAERMVGECPAHIRQQYVDWLLLRD